MDCLSSLLLCLPHLREVPSPSLQPDEKCILTNQPVPYSDDAAGQFIETLQKANACDEELEQRLDQIVSANGWTENLAEAILHGIEKILREGGLMAAAMSSATEKAIAMAEEFAKEHPYYTALIAGGTLIALGILAIMAPWWVLRALGFVVKGPRNNSFAARWMSQIARKYGNVSKGTLYSYLQRLGMVWK